MGAGATAMAEDAGLHEAVAGAGWAPTVQRVLAADPGTGEIARTFDLLRAQERTVREAVERGAFPLVLAGGCVSAAGTVAGARNARGLTEDVGAVWLDAHADLDTPEDNISGFLDVMALTILTGTAWRAARATIPGFVAVREADVALLGVRDLADYQRARVERSPARVVPGAFGVDDAAAAIGTLPPHRYLHVDLDVLDTSVGHANRYASPGGPSLEVVLAAIDATFAHGTVIAAALTAYDPPADRSGAILAAARTIAQRIAVRALAQR
jgi:arginase